MLSSLEFIGRCAWKECKELKSATIPSSVKEIGDRLFLDCQSLENVTFAFPVEQIPQGENVTAFLGRVLEKRPATCTARFSNGTFVCVDGDWRAQ
ncbi:MAG: leucine-rich repeat domain-containing protein [Holosporales bacterium]|nr:leucine-rich repeat domain-containing protein [Holosporales bacterium]